MIHVEYSGDCGGVSRLQDSSKSHSYFKCKLYDNNINKGHDIGYLAWWFQAS